MVTIAAPTQEVHADRVLPEMLNPGVARKIDYALHRVGQCGEIRLLVVNGRVRFIEVMQEPDAEPV